MKYSIVVPTYNSFQYMEYLLSFIESQNRDDFEVIFVDDCSTDDTYEELCKYEEKCKKNIYVYRNEINSGPGIARNLGMKKANGEWIVFLDSDDSLALDFFETISQIIEKSHADCILYDSNVYDRNNKLVQQPVTVYGKKEGYISIEDAVAFAIPGIRKCFKKELISNEQVQFNSFKRGEDLIFYDLLYVSRPGLKLYYTKKKLYYIHQRDGSLSNGAETFNIMPQVYKYLYEHMPSSYREAINISSVRMLLYGGVLQMTKNKDSKEEIKQFIADYEKMFPDWYKSIGYNILGNRKKIFLYLVKHRCLMLINLYVKLHKIYTTR